MPNPTLTLGALRMVAERPADGHLVSVLVEGEFTRRLFVSPAEWLSLTRVAEVVEAAREYIDGQRSSGHDSIYRWARGRLRKLLAALDSLAAVQEKNNG